HISLEAGKLTADVPREAVGFAVQTPRLLVVDLGTSFGIEIPRNGDDQVHVFKGQVELKFRGPLDQEDRRQSVRLHAGEALRIDRRQFAVKALLTDQGRFYGASSEDRARQRSLLAR